MPAHATAARPLRIRQERERDTGHLIRGVGYVTECTCGWRSPRCREFAAAVEVGRMHVRAHAAENERRVIPPPGTVPPPAAGEAAQATRERED